jgi:hypothetical protein
LIRYLLANGSIHRLLITLLVIRLLVPCLKGRLTSRLNTWLRLLLKLLLVQRLTPRWYNSLALWLHTGLGLLLELLLVHRLAPRRYKSLAPWLHTGLELLLVHRLDTCRHHTTSIASTVHCSRSSIQSVDIAWAITWSHLLTHHDPAHSLALHCVHGLLVGHTWHAARHSSHWHHAASHHIARHRTASHLPIAGTTLAEARSLIAARAGSISYEHNLGNVHSIYVASRTNLSTSLSSSRSNPL